MGLGRSREIALFRISRRNSTFASRLSFKKLRVKTRRRGKLFRRQKLYHSMNRNSSHVAHHYSKLFMITTMMTTAMTTKAQHQSAPGLVSQEQGRNQTSRPANPPAGRPFLRPLYHDNQPTLQDPFCKRRMVDRSAITGANHSNRNCCFDLAVATDTIRLSMASCGDGVSPYFPACTCVYSNDFTTTLP